MPAPSVTVPGQRGPACLAALEFGAMCVSFRATGGVARVDDLVRRFRSHGGASAAVLASWIERRQVICFEWRDAIWLPWFQFHRVDLVPHPQLAPVFDELTPVFDAWEMADWFARPNAWLAHRTPVALLVSDLAAVRDAARADRFIANG